MRHSHYLRTAAIIGLVTTLSTSLGGCASLQKQFADFKLDMSRKDIAPVEMNAAILNIEEPFAEDVHPVEIEFIKPLVMPGQMKLRPASITYSGLVLKPFEAIEQANASASIEPNSSNYLNAIQVYPYTPG